MSTHNKENKELLHRCIPCLNPKPELYDVAIYGLRALKGIYDVSSLEAMDAMRLCVEIAVLRKCQGRRTMSSAPKMSAWIEMMWAHKEVESRWMPEYRLETWSSRTKMRLAAKSI